MTYASLNGVAREFEQKPPLSRLSQQKALLGGLVDLSNSSRKVLRKS
jgi:hypothetical protein